MIDEAVDIVVFDVGGTRYGVDLTQVLRVTRAAAPRSPTPLGSPREGRRGLVYLREGVEQVLPIDLIHGVRSVPVGNLRRLPAVAVGSKIPLGAWLDGEEAVLLVDLAAIDSPPDGS